MKNCKNCNKKFRGTGKFCNNSCKLTAWTKYRKALSTEAWKLYRKFIG